MPVAMPLASTWRLLSAFCAPLPAPFARLCLRLSRAIGSRLLYVGAPFVELSRDHAFSRKNRYVIGGLPDTAERNSSLAVPLMDRTQEASVRQKMFWKEGQLKCNLEFSWIERLHLRLQAQRLVSVRRAV